MTTRRSTTRYLDYPVEETDSLYLSRKHALDLLAAVELAPFEHEELEQKLLDFLTQRRRNPAKN